MHESKRIETSCGLVIHTHSKKRQAYRAGSLNCGISESRLVGLLCRSNILPIRISAISRVQMMGQALKAPRASNKRRDRGGTERRGEGDKTQGDGTPGNDRASSGESSTPLPQATGSESRQK